jgi:hypothetical protein
VAGDGGGDLNAHPLNGSCGSDVFEFHVQCRRAAYNPELIRPNKPERGATGKRIDAVPAAAMALSAWKPAGSSNRAARPTKTTAG